MCTKRDGFDKGHGMLPFMGWPLAITLGLRMPPAIGHSIKGRIPKSSSFIPWFHATATASLACAQKIWKRTFCGCTSFSSWRRSILAGRMMDQGQVIQHARFKTLKDSKLLKVVEYGKVSVAGWGPSFADATRKSEASQSFGSIFHIVSPQSAAFEAVMAIPVIRPFGFVKNDNLHIVRVLFPCQRLGSVPVREWIWA